MNLYYYGVLLKACRNLLVFAAIFLHLGPCFSFCCISYDLMLLMGDFVWLDFSLLFFVFWILQVFVLIWCFILLIIIFCDYYDTLTFVLFFLVILLYLHSFLSLDISFIRFFLYFWIWLFCFFLLNIILIVGFFFLFLRFYWNLIFICLLILIMLLFIFLSNLRIFFLCI